MGAAVNVSAWVIGCRLDSALGRSSLDAFIGVPSAIRSARTFRSQRWRGGVCLSRSSCSAGVYRVCRGAVVEYLCRWREAVRSHRERQTPHSDLKPVSPTSRLPNTSATLSAVPKAFSLFLVFLSSLIKLSPGCGLNCRRDASSKTKTENATQPCSASWPQHPGSRTYIAPSLEGPAVDPRFP